MKTNKKRIHISLYTEIDDGGIKETTESSHVGTYLKKADVEIITFTDTSNEIGPIENRIVIYPDKLSLKRKGAVMMNQLFAVGSKSECMYRHPFGVIPMEIYTHSMQLNRLNKTENGKVVIEYDMLFEGANRHYVLTLEYMEAV